MSVCSLQELRSTCLGNDNTPPGSSPWHGYRETRNAVSIIFSTGDTDGRIQGYRGRSPKGPASDSCQSFVGSHRQGGITSEGGSRGALREEELVGKRSRLFSAESRTNQHGVRSGAGCEFGRHRD